MLEWARQGRTLRVAAAALTAALLWAAVPAAAPVAAQRDLCTNPFVPVATALNDLGAGTYSRPGQTTGYQGGLYPDGANVRPPAHDAAGLEQAWQVQPLNAAGQPAADGRIVMVSIGMSNTGQEFGSFRALLRNNPLVNPLLTTVNGGVSGQTAERWLDPDSPEDRAWHELFLRLDAARVTPAQVQVAWVKLTLPRRGEFPDKAQELQADLEIIARLLKQEFPNLRIAYFSSRIRSYVVNSPGLSPDPEAYEGGFAVKWMIAKQIAGDATLNFDPARGPVVAPYLAWGPYLWADGLNARSDGLTWAAEDLYGDCTHPSETGKAKVAEMLYDFFTTDTTAAPWFLANPGEPVPTATPRPTSLVPTPTSTPPTTPRPTSLVPTPTPRGTATFLPAISTAPSPTPRP